MKKNKKIKSIGTISGKDLIVNSENKLGKHLAIVQTGTGKHKNKKAYNRKQNKRTIRKEYNDYYPSPNGSFLFYSSSV